METHFVEYDSLMSNYKAAERHFEKVYGQIEAMRANMARKARTALDSEMTVGEGDMLLGIAKEFKESVPEYEATLGEMECPCCRGVPALKQAAADMIEASDILRYPPLISNSLWSTELLKKQGRCRQEEGRSSMPASAARLPKSIARKSSWRHPSAMLGAKTPVA